MSATLNTLDPVERPVVRTPSALDKEPNWGAIVVASLVLHAGVLFALVWAPDRISRPVPDPIAVEVVTAPPPAPTAPKKTEPEALSTGGAAAQADAAGPSQPNSARAEAAQTDTTPHPAPLAPVDTPTQPPESTASPAPAPSASEPVRAPPPPAAPPVATGFDGLPASFRAVALPAISIGGAEAASYKAIVFGRLAAAKRYPEAARARRAAGTAVVAFSLDRSGRLQRASLARSSGDADLDAEALATVSRCDPFPPPPQGAQTSFAAGIEFGTDE